MDGLFFLWCSWIVVVYLYFFAGENKKMILIHVLILIFISQFVFQWDGWYVNSASLYLFFIAGFYIARKDASERVKIYATSFILALLQGSYYLFYILEPLWFMWVPSWIVHLLHVYVCTLLIHKNGNRILSFIMGKIISDILLLIVHFQNNLQYEYLQMAWLDQVAMILVFLLFWNMMEYVGKYVMNNSGHTQKKEV